MTILLPALAVAAFCVWLGVRVVNRRERWAKWTLATVIGMPVLYVASFGPACWINHQTRAFGWQIAFIALSATPLAAPTGGAVEAWLVDVWDGGPGAMLAHALDGVIWGWFWNGRLLTAERRAGDPWPPLRWETLMDLRMFSGEVELRMWRDGAGTLHAQRLAEAEGVQFIDSVDRDYLLLGRVTKPHDASFDARHGRRGERHAVPRGAEYVRVRHSFEADPQTGLLREAEHRWLGLFDGQGEPLR